MNSSWAKPDSSLMGGAQLKRARPCHAARASAGRARPYPARDRACAQWNDPRIVRHQDGYHQVRAIGWTPSVAECERVDLF